LSIRKTYSHQDHLQSYDYFLFRSSQIKEYGITCFKKICSATKKFVPQRLQSEILTKNRQRISATLFIIHHSSFIIHHSSFILHHSSFIIHPSSFILHPSSFILHPSSFIIHPSSFILHFIIHHSSFSYNPHVLTDTTKHEKCFNHRDHRDHRGILSVSSVISVVILCFI